ncbi:MAG TPA: hypothetical protein VG125_13990 [Pirellulales bacterium]|jgi:hypothetical protein|nr:hypothetical protein [Pirellulales bacterium]
MNVLHHTGHGLLLDSERDELVSMQVDMMAKAPHKRIQSTAEVVSRLEPWARPEQQLEP